MKSKFVLVGVLAFLAAGVIGAGSAQASSCWYSPRGCVYVHSYYKPSTGSYVHSYYRNYPGYGSSYRSYYPRYSYRSYYPRYSYGW